MAIRVLSDPDLESRLIAEAHEHVRRFDWADIAAETAALYADLIGESKPKVPPSRSSGVQ
jgi:glycogen(starch) synthase